MSIFGWLFRSKPERQRASVGKPSSRQSRRELTFSDGYLTIESENFFGAVAKSQDSHWAVAWQENGSSARSHGTVVLVDTRNQEIKCRIRAMQRPANGRCANDGTFVIEDWRWNDGLNGHLVVFDRQGNERYRRKFAANLFGCGISPCGRFVCSQTCEADDDGNLLELADVESGRKLFSIHPVTYWATDYELRVEGDRLTMLTVTLAQFGDFSYGPDGVFLDHKRWFEARLLRGGPDAVVDAASEHLASEGTVEAVNLILQSVERVLGDPALAAVERARLLKVKGAALEASGDARGALATYEAALVADPKITVKRRLAALKKHTRPS